MLFHELRQFCDNSALCGVGLALAGLELIDSGSLASASMGKLLGYFCLVGGQVVLCSFPCFYRLIVCQNVLGFCFVREQLFDTFQPFRIGYSLRDNVTPLIGREGSFSPLPEDLRQLEQGLALFLVGGHTVSNLQLSHESGHLLIGEVSESGDTLENLGAGHTTVNAGQELQNLLLIALVLNLGLGLLLVAVTGVLLRQQFQLMVEDSHGVLDGGAIGHRLAVQQGLNVLETHGLGDAGLLLGVSHSAYFLSGYWEPPLICEVGFPLLLLHCTI